jgi:hypothetical protein
MKYLSTLILFFVVVSIQCQPQNTFNAFETGEFSSFWMLKWNNDSPEIIDTTFSQIWIRYGRNGNGKKGDINERTDSLIRVFFCPENIYLRSEECKKMPPEIEIELFKEEDGTFMGSTTENID